MPRKLLPHVERNLVKGRNYYSFRIGKGPRIRLPDDPNSQEFREAYAAALSGEVVRARKVDPAGSIGLLIASYIRSAGFVKLRGTSKKGYMTRLETMRIEHGQRSVSGLTRERIIKMLQPYADRPAAALDTLKKLRILIRHAIDLGWLQSDPSAGIKRPGTKEIRAWTDAELAAYERRWPIGKKQRTAYSLMLNVGTARADVHLMTWTQIDVDGIEYKRQKTGVAVAIEMATELRKALDAAPRIHVTIPESRNLASRSRSTVSAVSCAMRSGRRGYRWIADHTVLERPLDGAWQMPGCLRTTSWQRSATRHWHKLKTTRAKLIGGGAAVARCCNRTTITRTYLPKPHRSVWGKL